MFSSIAKPELEEDLLYDRECDTLINAGAAWLPLLAT